MTELEKLFKIAPPPKVRLGAGSPQQWEDLEQKFDLKFPNDFKEFVAAYGAGRFVDFFGVANPFYTSDGDISFQEFVHLRTRDMAAAKDSYPETAISLPVYPQKGGLFPWGYTDNGETICWLTQGNASAWPIVSLEVGYLKNYEKFELTMVEFIQKWLTKEILVTTLTPPNFYPLKQPVYSAYIK